MYRLFGVLLLCVSALVSAPAYGAEEDHGEHESESESEELTLDIDEQNTAGIHVAVVSLQRLQENIRLPGEVRVNAYRSVRITPRITAQVAARHVRLGDKVRSGQPLVTLSSVEMAEAQGQLLVADREWQRVEGLGRETVSEKRYTEADVARQLARAKVIAYGMTEQQAKSLVESADAARATGAFDLIATQSGTVLQDEFVVGELIEPGRTLFDISDESVMWVEAQRLPRGVTDIEPGTDARVSIDGTIWIKGEVTQLHHRLDETTRTRGLRIEVDNSDDQLHPGQFVEVEVSAGRHQSVLAVQSSAVTLLEGSPNVFKIEEGNTFHPQPVVTGDSIGDWVVIESGLTAGDKIATEGVFHLKSLLLKSSLGEGHGH